MTGKILRRVWAVLIVLALWSAGAGFGAASPQKAALEAALQKVTVSPMDGAAHWELARAYNFNGEPGKAASEAKAALALIPGYAPAVLELAHARRAEGRDEEAAGLYKTYLSSNPRSPEGLAGISESLARLERWDESFASAIAAIKESPREAVGYGALGRAYRIAGRFREAVEVLGQGLAFSPCRAAMLYDMGMCLAELGDRVAALAQYEKLLNLDRDMAALLFEKIYP